ncbi:MAG: hypothetical protein ACI9TV_002257 [Sulfurimonas sp.]|jgi:hypothetical protein|uniref:nuclear transport factor 2 family protein n=1 Tax=Sulfurimonas sp. TaxID=2022749 RepID=UPI0039E5FE75
MSRVQEYAEFYKKLNAKTPLEEYEKFFDTNSYFEDPFQKVIGIEKIYHIFEDMYAKLYNPKFEIDESISQDNTAYIKWTFLYQMDEKSQVESFVGVSRVVFSDDGKVLEHVDFWDAGVNVYEKIPLLGSIIRYIKRKIHA